jgi:hypothetical protein
MFWMSAVIGIVLAITLVVAINANMTSKGIFDFLKSSKTDNVVNNSVNNTPKMYATANDTNFTDSTDNIATPSSERVTYQGVLEMLNSCQLSVTWDWNETGNSECASNVPNSTCIATYVVGYANGGTTLRYECDWQLGQGGNKSLTAVCCYPNDNLNVIGMGVVNNSDNDTVRIMNMVNSSDNDTTRHI